MKRKFLVMFMTFSLFALTACGTAANSANPGDTASTNESTNASAEPVITSAAPAAASVSDTQNYQNSITVNSSETVSVVPDVAQIVYSVRTEAKNAADCQQQNTEAVAEVIALLKSLNVEEASIQTSDYYMHPVYNYSNNTSRIVGYEAATSLTVSDLPIDELDSILSQSVLSGINTIQNITYMASEYDKSYQEALTKAVATAYEKAQALASASGASVGNVIRIQETSGYSEARYTDYARSDMVNSMGAMKQEAALADTASIMPGEISVEAGIIVEYELLPLLPES